MRLFKTSKGDSRRLQAYEFIAAPAHLWLWVCARLCGGRFECGPAESAEGKELEALAAFRAQFIPELFSDKAIAVHRGLAARIPVEKYVNPCKRVMLVCDELPTGEAMLCLMVSLTDYWTRTREAFEAHKRF